MHKRSNSSLASQTKLPNSSSNILNSNANSNANSNTSVSSSTSTLVSSTSNHKSTSKLVDAGLKKEESKNMDAAESRISFKVQNNQPLQNLTNVGKNSKNARHKRSQSCTVESISFKKSFLQNISPQFQTLYDESSNIG